MGRLLSILIGALIALVIGILKATWRVRLVGPDPRFDTPHVFCFWHGRFAGLLAHPRHRPLLVLVSLSKDGNLLSCILTHLGLSVVRGSSSRKGAVGYRTLVNAVGSFNNDADIAFAVDGPRGPLGEVKKGAAKAAGDVRGTIVPMTFAADREWVFGKAWDRFALPKPFAKVDIIRAEPLDFENKDLDGGSLQLQSVLRHLDRKPTR